MAVYSLVVLLLSLVPVLQVWLSKLVIDAMARHASVTAVVVLATLFVATMVLQAALQPAERALGAWLQEQAVAEVDRALMRAGVRLADLYQVERPAFQDELRLLQDASHYLPRLFGVIRGVLGSIIKLAGLLALLAGLQPLLAAALAVTAIPHMILERRNVYVSFSNLGEYSRAAREMDYCAGVTTSPDAAKEVRVFDLGDFFLQRFRVRFAAAHAEVRQRRLRQLWVSATFVGLHALVLAVGFWYVAAQVGAGRLTIGDIFLYVNAIMQAQSSLLLLSPRLGTLYETYRHLRGFFAFLDGARPAVALPPTGHGRPAPARMASGIELRRVNFAYPDSAGAVLEGVSALLPAGQVSALVGTNGAGKSTLVKLLTRMYDQTAGEILLDGVPLAAYDLDQLRRRIAVVYQDFARFSLTLRENVALGASEPGDGSDRVEEAARWAGADAIAAKLPEGYDTELTRQFEGGVDLSGGEWQKVALARGFVRDAALVILDEPTSALDADAEYQLFARFRELIAGSTALIISHRFSTVRMADQILVLDEGRIVEQGSHVELLGQGGRYAQLFEMQAGRYRESTV